MRILFLVYSPQESLPQDNNSGITKCSWIDSLLDELKKCQGITIAVALPISSNYFEKDIIGSIKIYGLPNHKERNIFKKVYNKLVFAIESNKINNHIQTVIDDFNPDIIQNFGTENPFGLIVPKLNKPFIIHLQGFLMVWERKYFAGISRFEQFRYSSLTNLIFRRGSYNGFFIFRKRSKLEYKVIASCNLFMGRTDFDKRIISLLSPNSTYFNCEEFIRQEFFEQKWNYPLRNEIICISTLNGTTYKGIDLLIEAFIVLQKHTQFTYKFKICGVSPKDDFVTILKKKYKKEAIFENIEFLGKLSVSELVGQLCNSNFYVHPSYIENSPNSVCEAMVLGMPIVATKVGGVCSIIQDKVEGLLVQEGDPYSFAAAVFELTNNYTFAESLGKSAREKAIIRHDPKKITKRLLGIYQNVLSKRIK